MGWTDLSGAFGYGTKLTSAQMQNLRDNVSAVPAGNAGAPRIVNAAIGSHEITWQRFAAAADSDCIVGSTRKTGLGGDLYQWEVFGADGVWYQTCPSFIEEA